MKLVIVESPNKVKKIQTYLGNEYKVAATAGHIYAMDTKRGIKCIQEDYEPIMRTIPSKKKYIDTIKKLYKECSELYLATDADNEGERIAYDVCHLLKATGIRLIFREITQTAIQNAVRTVIDMDKVAAQKGRSVLDLLIGFKLSNPVSRGLGQQGLSVGRCQTPALKLIYEHHKLPDKSKITYTITGIFEGYTFILNKHMDPPILEIQEFILNHTDEKELKYKPPLPLTTSKLQQESPYSPKDTMKIAQTLYEKGYITYMRTDNNKISRDFADKATQYITDSYGAEYVGIPPVGEGQAHEAIRPTDISRMTIEGDREQKVYRLIWFHAVAACCSSAVYKSYTAYIPYRTYKFERPIKECTFEGYTIIDGVKSPNPEYEILNITRPIKHDELRAELTVLNHKSHYSESSLVANLEKLGIGRPSTYSSIVSVIQERGYVVKGNVEGQTIEGTEYILKSTLKQKQVRKVMNSEKNKLKITPLGIEVAEFVLSHYNNVFEYEYTKQMEEKLDEIAEHRKDWRELCRECDEVIDPMATLKIEKKQVIIDELDGHPITMRHTKFGDYAIWNGYTIKYMDGDLKPVFKSIEGNPLFKANKTATERSIKYEETEEMIRQYRQLADNKAYSGIVRPITDILSIRKGRYGLYIYYRPLEAKKPKFLKLTIDPFIELDALKHWIETTYGDVMSSNVR
jgi:DNA topoisomerase-1